MATPKQRKPRFFWQAVLIVLPVLILTLVGWAAVRQDKILVQHEASARAQAIANEVADKIWAELNQINPSGRLHFTVDGRGRLVFPPACESPPIPQPFHLAELDQNQRRLWIEAQNARSTETWENFLQSKPPERFAAAAWFGLGLLLKEQGKIEPAVRAFKAVRENFPDVFGESGLPLALLAQWKLLELAATPGGPLSAASNLIVAESFYSNVVFQPTALTPFFLTRPLEPESPAMAQWRNQSLGLWEIHERLRDFFHVALNKFSSATWPPIFWLEMPPGWSRGTPQHAGTNLVSFSSTDRHWLVLETAVNTTNRSFLCLSESELNSTLSRRLKETEGVPEYFSVGVTLASRTPPSFAPDLRLWTYQHSGGKTGVVRKEYKTDFSGKRFVLATNALASATKLADAAEALRVTVYLTSPDALFQHQQARTLVFGAVLVSSNIAALIGLVAAWRAFQRQLRLNELKSNFVSSVSHELRAPIAAVRLLAENLERGKVSDPAKQAEYFRFIGRECRRVSALIENVLDFARIEQGRKHYDPEPTNLVALVCESVRLMEPYAAERGVRLETLNVEHRAPNIELSMDGRAIQQALINLLDNAIKHSPPGKAVTVELRESSENTLPGAAAAAPSPTVLISVIDRGPGIPPSEHEKIFERFYRLGSELRRETPGVGIGLSIVKHIVEAHGGRVRVESRPGQGSRFTIELPQSRKSDFSRG